MFTQKGFNLGNNTHEQFTEFKNDWTLTSQLLRLTGLGALRVHSAETFPADNLERAMGIEPTTFSLGTNLR